MNPTEKLRDVVANGITLAIFDAEEAFSLEEFIGIHAEAINNATFGAFFGSLQRFLNRQLILSVASLYEAPNKRYPIRSIPVALEIMEQNAHRLPIPERPDLFSGLIGLGFDIERLERMKESELTLKVVSYFRHKIPKPKEESVSLLDQALHATKTLRDKTVAHPEVVAWSDLPKPTYTDLKKLVDIAKDFVSIVGFPYLSTIYRCDNGEYLLSADSTRSRLCLKRILAKLGIQVEEIRL